MNPTPLSLHPFDLATFPLEGLRLIEASAGTGKTFSLAGLYLRLLVEKQLDVRDILVMTFTRAATQELRDRIRMRLATAARLAQDPEQVDESNIEHTLARDLIDAASVNEPREQIARRLRDAAARMDDAAISTIHGFAQQATQENAFDSGLPFDRGTQVDDAEIHHEVITDYWRSHVLGRPADQAQVFLELWPKAEALLTDLKPAFDKPHLDLWERPGAQLRELTDTARAVWTSDREQFGELLRAAVAGKMLRKNEGLNQAIESAGGVEGLLAQIGAGLAGTASERVILPAWLSDLATEEGAKLHIKNNGLKSCRPWDLPLVHALAALAPVARIAALRAALAATRATIRSRKRAGRQFSFADMIEALHVAVTDADKGPALAAALHRTWPYALVDEFQDTDPLQYEILRAVYRDRDVGALIMIGDPKQAIYGFRGGDVYAYLQAARDADGCYGLETNFRSTQAVLDGIDALFRGPAAETALGEFLVPDIRFHSVRCGREQDDRVLVQGGERLPAVTAWALPGSEHTADDGRRLLLQATVSEIASLLDATGGAWVRTRDGAESPVQPGDIAVLVNTNREAADVQRALARRGIPAVCLHRASVFASEQAEDVFHLLRAADSSARPDAVRAALATPLLGLRMEQLLALSDDERAWHQAVARFQNAHETWRSRGVLAMLEPFLQAAASRVLALEDGERRMTNYLQLAELLAQAETETFGFAGLIRWLAEQIEDPQAGAEVEDQQLRLESDDALVRIVTVHRVKGLEYPIVFVPFTQALAAKALDSGTPWIFHDEDGRAWLDFGVDGDDHKARANIEARAETLRVLYVALTRAKQALYFGWGAIRCAENAALAWLLHPGEVEVETISRANAEFPDWLTGESVEAGLQAFADRAGGAVRVVPPPAPLAADFRAPPGSPPEGAARVDLPARRPEWSVFSFSRLVAGGKHRVPGSGGDDESPDPVPAVPASPSTHGRIALQGAAFGTAVHQLLEAVDPTNWPEPDIQPQDTHRALVARHLSNAGLPLGAGSVRTALLDAVAGMVSRTLYTPLPAIGPLAHVPAGRRLVEMEFFLMLGGERIGRILEFMNASGYGVSLAPERAQQTLNGLMQGFVDLTVEADGRYWIIDYKTNDLGADPAGYGPDALARAVRYGHYDLQYLIYLVALHRHLQRTLPGYDPARHLGGAQYLFLRGLDGVSAATGVFVDSPPPDFLITLDSLFLGRSVAA
jgi:exodeoxyribonuclease V beta subunit